MDTNKKSGLYYMTGGFNIFAIFLLAIITLWVNIYLAVAEFLLGFSLCFVNYLYKKQSEKKISDMFEHLTLRVGSATSHALMQFPLPTLIIEHGGNIKWYNKAFCAKFEENHLYDKNVSEVIPSLIPETIFQNPPVPVQTTIVNKDKTFRVFGSQPQEEDKNSIIVLYFDDITEYADYKQKYHDERPFSCMIFVDNYEELLESTAISFRPILEAKIYKHINDWVTEHGGVLVKYEKDKYSVMFEYRYLDEFIENKFEILSKIRNISEGNAIPASISIGIGACGKDIVENDEFAKTAINMALGRGGDQAVVKDNEQLQFYGGNSKEYEKSTRVKARVVSVALSGLIENANNVIVMSHKEADMDALGAAFGVYRMCRMQDKPVNIVLESYDQTVQNMLERLENVEEYAELFLNTQQAAARMNGTTLLVVVDAHKPNLLEAPALLKKAGQIVVIDHHRRGAEFIENTALIYHEPYASSTCEMMAEILQYSADKMSLTKLEAECLYAGVLMDTKNFTFKTGVRTFEVASFLRKQGVDTVTIKTMFQQDLTSYIKRAMIVKDAEIFRDHIAVSTYNEIEENIHVTIAQAADELLNIKGITASFVLSKTEEGISISGRSLGNINVQVILEKLGGGGHMTIAGAQLYEMTIGEAKEQLKQAIDAYYLETVN